MAQSLEDALGLDSGVTSLEDALGATEKPKFQSPGLVENIKSEAVGGLRQMFNPSESEFLGSSYLKDLPVVGDVPKNVLSSLMGGARALYSLPQGAINTYVGDPLREAGWDKTAAALEGALGIGAGFVGGGVPGITKAMKFLGLGEAPNMLRFGLAGAENPLVRLAGRTLDPLATSSPRMLEQAQARMTKRVGNIQRLEGDIGAAQESLRGLEAQVPQARQSLRSVEQQMEDLRMAANESKDAELAQTSRIPVEPTAPRIESVPGAAKAANVGEEVQGMLQTGRKAEYTASSARYQKVQAEAAQIPLDNEQLNAIQGVVDKLGGEVRLTPASRGARQAVGLDNLAEDAGKIEDLTHVRDVSPDVAARAEQMAIEGRPAKEIVDYLTGNLNSNPTLAGAMRAEQILSAAARGYAKSGKIAERAAVNELKAPFTKLLEQSPIGAALGEAKAGHRGVAELIGPDSIISRVFNMKPEQVIDNIFLPEGRANPNVSLIRDAKEIAQKTQPAEWAKMTGAALAKFEERVRDATGAIDPLKFGREWKKYRSTFEAALEPDGLKAIDAIAEGAQRYAQSKQLYQRQLGQVGREEKAVREFYQRQRAQLGVEKGKLLPAKRTATNAVADLEQQIHDTNKHIKQLTEQLTREKTLGLRGGDLTSAVMSPHLMIAVAQFGQALQASFTGNWVGVARQFLQGVVWATLGNPIWLAKLAQNPHLAQAVNVALQVQKGAHVSLEAGRLLNGALRAVGDEVFEEGRK